MWIVKYKWSVNISIDIATIYLKELVINKKGTCSTSRLSDFLRKETRHTKAYFGHSSSIQSINSVKD